MQTPSADKATILAALSEARERTWQLASGFTDKDLQAPAASYLSPPVWDLGHMANFEELWLVQNLLGCGELHAGDNDRYDAFAHPRSERPNLKLLDRAGARAYMAEVRDRTASVLEDIQMDDAETTPLLRDGFVYWLIVLHEHQHQETLLQSIQLLGPDRYQISQTWALPEPSQPTAPNWLTIPEGPFTMGIHQAPGVYDNEAPAHEVHVPAFQIARYPVTVGEYKEFIEAGGYENAQLWSERGTQWLDDEPHHAPLNWEQRDGTRWRVSPSGATRIDSIPDEILCHVTHFEAEAYANWRGARLPTEAEWEKAARFDPATGQSRRNPWGNTPATAAHANIDQLAWHPSRIGAYPSAASPGGAQHMIGDVWEWTSSGFEAYPGFRAFPYPEYSDVFFGGDYKMLRGGCWASRAGCATGTFRNWDHPYRRQIFSGIRLARDSSPEPPSF